jgi:tetratricopeptide (TPR) repeat protein
VKRLCSPTQLSGAGIGVLVCALSLTPVSQALAAPAQEEAEAPPAGEAAPTPTGDAAPTQEPSTTDKAVAAFESGDFDNAITLFEQAYAEDEDPNYLFNIGRVFEEKGDLRSAIDRYEKFVNSAGVDLDSRQFANERLKVLRDIVAAEDAAKAKEEQRLADAEAAKQAEAEAAANPQPEGPSQADIASKRTRTIGFVLLGVGAAAAAGGGAAGGLALGKHKDFESETDPAAAATLKQDGQTLSSAADGLFIAGGVVAVAGLVMVLTTLDKNKGKADKKSARTNLQPHFGRTGAGLSLSHRF